MVKGLAVLSMFAVTVATTAGCGVSQSASAPPLTGPSQFALAVTLAANPDRISLDGGSQSLITAEARGPNGELKANVPLRVDMVVNGVLQDYGTLTSRNIVTGTDGKANATYTAPLLPALANQTVFTVSIRVIAVGTDAVTAVVHTVDIRLVPPGVILPPADTPTAAFTLQPTPVSLNLAVTFDASRSCPGPANASGCLPSSSAAITSYAWTFGDGGTGSGRTVSHTFTALGTFNATLTIVNDRGVAASATQAIQVGATTAPTALFVFSPTAPGVHQTINFNAASSLAAPGRSIANYSWNFGDGGTGGGVAPTHAFAAADTYNVTLTVTDDVGQSGTISQGVTVSAAPPVAAFVPSPTPASAGVPVNFTSTSTMPSGAAITSYVWIWGDGTGNCPANCLSGVAPFSTVSHVFQPVGPSKTVTTYSVILTVKDTNNLTSTVTVPVPVTTP